MVHVTENRSVTMKTTDRKYLAALRKRYARASKKERGQMLDDYVRTTGCHRKHAIAVLRGQRSCTPAAIHRPRRSQYTAEDARALQKLSDLFDGINAKLLRVALDNELAHLYRSGFLQGESGLLSALAVDQSRLHRPRTHALWAGPVPARQTGPHQTRVVAQKSNPHSHLGRLGRRSTRLHRNGLGLA
jgi:hypothetical protein